MTKFNWVTDYSRQFMHHNDSYLDKNETYEERVREICDTFERISGIEGFSDRFYSYCERGWVSFASPVLSNMGKEKALPASCNFSMVPDSVDGIFTSLKEMAMLAKNSAGTAYNFSSIRGMGEPISTGFKSEGVTPWIKLFEEGIQKVTQSSLRRGFLTAYLSADHKDIMDFLDLGTPGNPIQRITTGVTFPKGYISDAKNGDTQKQEVIKKTLRRRGEQGWPYVYFEDNCNDNKPQVYKDKDMHLYSSNICSEIVEYCDEEKTFVCVLSSANLNHYDEWKNTDFIFDFRIALDCVVEEYITKGKQIEGISKSVKFAEEHRAVGLGVLGFHDLLQKKELALASFEARALNQEVFKHLESESTRASKWMAKEWGEPEIMKGYGLRSSTNLAIAPTKSSAFIMGMVSSGIEAIKSNAHEKDLANISEMYRNPNLKVLLEELGKDTEEVWQQIEANNGSVSALDFLTEEQKNVYKTAYEVNQHDLIVLAAERQKYIDQGQSLNLFIHPDAPARDVASLFFKAHELGVKTLYYQYSISATQEFNKTQLTCTSCEG
jgi:ribonucleoside-diphosphate reductase alpha chain